MAPVQAGPADVTTVLQAPGTDATLVHGATAEPEAPVEAPVPPAPPGPLEPPAPPAPPDPLEPPEPREPSRPSEPLPPDGVPPGRSQPSWTDAPVTPVVSSVEGVEVDPDVAKRTRR
jgi:hypothetical protein